MGGYPNCTDSLVHTWLKTGPVTVLIDAYPLFSYSTGIFYPTAKTKCTTVNHAVTLVGYGYDSETKFNYWLVRNSWGRKWGMAGYFKVKDVQNIENDSCFLTEWAFQPIVA